MQPHTGEIIEINFERSSENVTAEVWGGFFITGVQVEDGGTLMLSVRYVGCEDGKRMNTKYHPHGVYVHLCGVHACLQEPMAGNDTVHAREVRFWTVEQYLTSEFLTEGQKAAVELWVAEMAHEAGAEAFKATPKRSAKSPVVGKATPTRKPATRAPAKGRGRGRGEGAETGMAHLLQGGVQEQTLPRRVEKSPPKDLQPRARARKALQLLAVAVQL